MKRQQDDIIDLRVSFRTEEGYKTGSVIDQEDDGTILIEGDDHFIYKTKVHLVTIIDD